MAVKSTDRFLVAAALCILAILLFDFMSLIIKHLSPRYGAAELSAWRNLFGVAPSLIALYLTPGWRKRPGRWRMRQWPLAASRGIAVTFAQFLFYLSLGRIAFATASTISYSMAVFATGFAALLLAERVGPIRWSAYLVGFAGVIWVMRPGSDLFTWDSALPVGAAALYAYLSVTARMVDDDVPSALLNVWSAGFSILGAFALAFVTGGFTPIASFGDILWIVAMGGFGGAAVLIYVVAYRLTEPSNLSPVTYLGIPLAFLLGWLFFDEAPWADLFPGAILIAASGLLIVWREQRLKDRASR